MTSDRRMVVNSGNLLFILYPAVETPLCSLQRMTRIRRFSCSTEHYTSDTCKNKLNDGFQDLGPKCMEILN